jgi:phospholipid/cholesterol/gamma-HCH transport system permease protein
MEVSSARTPRLRGGLAPELRSSRVARGLAAPVESAIHEAAELGAFAGRALLQLGGVWRYSAEIIRQTGILVVGTVSVVAAMALLMGFVCGTEATYVLRGYGATVYSGVFTSYCGREMIPHIFGYIFAAKVGCGFAAELGAMKIQDELDAMESMGLSPMRYVVGTRLVATLLCIPALFFVTTAGYYLGNLIIIVAQIQEVSQGGWENVHWLFSSPLDQFYTFLRVLVAGVMIAIIGMFYGYRATGGPVGVGTATAKSMILNLVLLHVVMAGMMMMFWGLSPNAPVGG